MPQISNSCRRELPNEAREECPDISGEGVAQLFLRDVKMSLAVEQSPPHGSDSPQKTAHIVLALVSVHANQS